MKFSVIMASRLVDYPSSAKNKDEKIIRAIASVIEQTYSNWELHVIADGCQRTVEIVSEINYPKIKLWEVEHKRLWAGTPRNKGISEATGEWIIYLDIDDIYGKNHLKIVSEGLAGYDWVWFNDIRYKPKIDYWYENHCDINKVGMHGTSNVAHKKSLGVTWDENGKYSHDYHFVRKLLKFQNYGRISTPEYFVAHVPGTPNTGGYDI